MRLALSYVLAVLMAAGGAPAPQGSESARFVSTSSDLVVLPVTVIDRQNRFVSDLSRERFTVFDDGRPQEIALFSNEDTPVTIGLVIDDSGSMQPKLAEVIIAAAAFVRSSNLLDELFALEFNDVVRNAMPRRQLLAVDGDAVSAAMSSLVPRGRTALYNALVAGLDSVDEGTRPRKVLVLISDGGDNASQATFEQVIARARKSNVTIYTIGLFDRDDPDQNPGILKSLARETGGERFLPSSPAQLLEACQRIAREIRSGYTLGYVPPDRDGTYHQVRVQVDLPDKRRVTVRTRPGYFAARAATRQ
jgi:Ca-activated chloride channel family protein